MSWINASGLEQFEIDPSLAESMIAKVSGLLNGRNSKIHDVACVGLFKNGQQQIGLSYKTRIMSLTMHAEAVLLAAAALQGNYELVAITGPNCHACKQLLWENSVHTGIEILILKRQDEQIAIEPLSTMMVDAWPENPWLNRQPRS